MLNTEEGIEGAKVYLDPTWKFLSHRARKASARYHSDARAHELHATHQWPGDEGCPQLGRTQLRADD